MKVFSLVGWSGSGKSTVITGLISHFKARNKIVLVLKNVPHEYSLQPKAKDSFKFLEAGADRVILNSKGEMILMKRKNESEDILGIIQSTIPDADWMFLEGLVLDNVPVVQVLGSGSREGFKFPLDRCCAIVSDNKISATIPWFHKENVAGLAQFMEVYDHD